MGRVAALLELVTAIAARLIRLVPRGCKPINNRTHRQADTDAVLDRKANRAKLEHHTVVSKQHSLDAMRLRVRQPNDIAYGQCPSGNQLHRHPPSLGPTAT